MIHIKVTCRNGNYWSTGFNGTLFEAKAYFLTQSFIREDGAGREIEEDPISVEEITI